MYWLVHKTYLFGVKHQWMSSSSCLMMLHILIIHVYVNNAIRHLYSKSKLFITLSVSYVCRMLATLRI